MLAVGNCCYVAVCSVAQGASAPTGGGEGRGHIVAAGRLEHVISHIHSYCHIGLHTRIFVILSDIILPIYETWILDTGQTDEEFRTRMVLSCPIVNPHTSLNSATHTFSYRGGSRGGVAGVGIPPPFFTHVIFFHVAFCISEVAASFRCKQPA